MVYHTMYKPVHLCTETELPFEITHATALVCLSNEKEFDGSAITTKTIGSSSLKVLK
jgi:hypothetical protein